MDFVHGQLATGRKIRALTVVDTFSRCSIRGSATRVRTLYRPWRRPAPWLAMQGRSGSTRAPRSSAGTGLVGLNQRRGAGLLPTRQAYGQCLYRSLQRALPGRVPEHPLVPDVCRRPRKAGGMAQILHRGSAARCHRQQAPITVTNPGDAGRHRESGRETLTRGGPENGVGSKSALL